MLRSPSSNTSLRAGCLAVLFAALASASSAAEQLVIIPFEDAKFAPVSPTNPNGTQIAVLRGEPDTGPSDMLMKTPRSEGQLHFHTSDYRLTVISGVMKHWTPQSGRENAKSLGPGSYWFQPGGQGHADDCLSDQCLMFISWAGPKDTKPWTPAVPK